jgi:hypothetical protein
VLTPTNLAMFHDVMDEEENFFIKRVADANVIMMPAIHEFAIRILQRMFYGIRFLRPRVDHRNGTEGWSSISTIATTKIHSGRAHVTILPIPEQKANKRCSGR